MGANYRCVRRRAATTDGDDGAAGGRGQTRRHAAITVPPRHRCPGTALRGDNLPPASLQAFWLCPSAPAGSSASLIHHR